MFGINFDGYPAFISYLWYTNLITTLKILHVEYQPIYRISEFSYSLILVSASAPKISYQSSTVLKQLA